jgi:hypothetical protein
MPKFLIQATYTPEGLKRLMKDTAASDSKSRWGGLAHSIFWVFRSSGGIVKVTRDFRTLSQEGKTT